MWKHVLCCIPLAVILSYLSQPVSSKGLSKHLPPLLPCLSALLHLLLNPPESGHPSNKITLSKVIKNLFQVWINMSQLFLGKHSMCWPFSSLLEACSLGLHGTIFSNSSVQKPTGHQHLDISQPSPTWHNPTKLMIFFPNLPLFQDLPSHTASLCTTLLMPEVQQSSTTASLLAPYHSFTI